MDNPLRRNLYDWVLLVGALAFLLAAFLPLVKYGEIAVGKVVPIHYDMNGRIDGWATKSALIYIALTALVLYALCLFYTRSYYKSGLSVKLTDQSVAKVYRLRVRLFRKLNLLIMAIFAYANNLSAALALRIIDESSWLLSPVIVTLLCIVVLIEVIVYFVRVNVL